FFFTASSTTEIYTLSLHDALPILGLEVEDDERRHRRVAHVRQGDADARAKRLARDEGSVLGRLGDGVRIRDARGDQRAHERADRDRKSTRLNSSHVAISYAVFCLK